MADKGAADKILEQIKSPEADTTDRGAATPDGGTVMDEPMRATGTDDPKPPAAQRPPGVSVIGDEVVPAQEEQPEDEQEGAAKAEEKPQSKGKPAAKRGSKDKAADKDKDARECPACGAEVKDKHAHYCPECHAGVGGAEE